MIIVKKTINNILSKYGYIVRKIEESNKPLNEPDIAPSIAIPPRQSINQQIRNFEKKYKQYSATHKTKKLHFGCGPRVLKDWINIDLYFEPYEKYMESYTEVHYPASIRGNRRNFFKFDITKAPLPIPDNSVDVIFHEDFLEHIGQRDQVAFLAESLRVLKKGGVHRVNTPDLISSMKTHANFKRGFIGTHFGEWDNHQHINVLSKSMLNEMALMVGYSKVIFNEKNKSISPHMPLEYRPNPKSRQSSNIHADLIK